MIGPNVGGVHFFDLDNTLWRIGGDVWLVDKEDPSQPLARLDNLDVTRITNGFYKSSGVKIEYNEQSYTIPTALFDKVNKKRKLPADRLGLSWIEFCDDNYINNNLTVFLLDNIRHLSNTCAKVCLLTGRAHADRHELVLGKLGEELSKIGVSVWKTYFVSDKMRDTDSTTIAMRKTRILLEHMVGLKFEGDEFVPIKQDWFTDVYFYDDDFINIDYATGVQSVLDDTLKNTSDQSMVDLVKARVRDNSLTLTTNMVTNNEVNRFRTKAVTLVEPETFGARVRRFDGSTK